MQNILLIGECGVGKTWVMRQLLESTHNHQKIKLNKFIFTETKFIIIVGKYDESTFQGSDRLSMAVMSDLQLMLDYAEHVNKTTIYEGDRFTNSKFIAKADPYIIKIAGNGELGRRKRNSNQSSRQIKSIKTRVGNIKENIVVENSEKTLELIRHLTVQPEPVWNPQEEEKVI